VSRKLAAKQFSRHMDLSWESPLYSSHLNPPEIFSCGCISENVCAIDVQIRIT
jgi:hypothetical protein